MAALRVEIKMLVEAQGDGGCVAALPSVCLPVACFAMLPPPSPSPPPSPLFIPKKG